MKNIIIRPITVEDSESFNACLDIVAREAKYLAMLEAPPLEQTQAFVNNNVVRGYPQIVANNGNRVVGWCDILPHGRITMKHCGTLGIGILPEYQGKGIGREMLTACISKAKDFGITRIELDVRCDNERAIRLYEKMGFIREGLKKKDKQIHGEYFDSIFMALLLPDL